MKKLKGWVTGMGFVLILGLIVAVPVHAEVTFDSWRNQWFKGTITDKGVVVDESETYKATDKATTYGYLAAWDEGIREYTFLLVQFDPKKGTWMDAVPYKAQVIGGTPLNYVFYGFVPPRTFPGIEVFALIMNATGKEKKGVLTSPSAKAIAGCVIYNNPGGGGPYFAANETLSFTSVSEKKVPDEVKQKIEEFFK